MRIFVSGSLAYDRIMNFPERFSDYILPEKIHVLNVSFMVNGVTERFGGTAGNIAYNLALLEEKPLILASAGRDFAGYGEWLQGHGLSLEAIRRVDEELTAGAYITTDKADNQITGFNPGAMKYPCGYSIDGVDPGDALAIVAPGNIQDMRDYCRIFREKAIPYIFDPGQSIPSQTGEALVEMVTGSRLLISNDYELEMIKRATRLSEADILERTDAIITTLGDQGSVVHSDGRTSAIPAVRAEAVLDPTGAGDAYRAGMIKGMVLGKDILDSARMGAVCASFGVQCQGTQCHKFTPEEFWARCEENFGPIA
jgi:adenosine kinase